MRERLREIAELAFGDGIIFFRQKPDIIPDFQQPLEHSDGLVMTPLQFIIVYHPERTRQKGSFSLGEAVDGGILCVSPDKAIFHKIGFDGLDRAHYSRIARREKADQ